LELKLIYARERITWLLNYFAAVGPAEGRCAQLAEIKKFKAQFFKDCRGEFQV
jgi:hypothetical protein